MMAAVFHFVNLIFITICTMFFVSTKGMFVKRTFLNIPLYICNASIIPIDREENFNPHFDLDHLKESVTYYLNLNLKNQIYKYNISFFPYLIDEENGKYYLNVDEDSIKNVQIHFICNYFLSFNVDLYMCYTINEKGVFSNEY